MPRIPALRRPTIRQSQNAVSSEIETVLLTPERLAFERIAAYIDRERLKLNSGQNERLAEMVTALGLEQRRHCDGDELVHLRALVLALGERLWICAGTITRMTEERKGT